MSVTVCDRGEGSVAKVSAMVCDVGAVIANVSVKVWGPNFCPSTFQHSFYFVFHERYLIGN
jgi:hypothetical protein